MYPGNVFLFRVAATRMHGGRVGDGDTTLRTQSHVTQATTSTSVIQAVPLHERLPGGSVGPEPGKDHGDHIGERATSCILAVRGSLEKGT